MKRLLILLLIICITPLYVNADDFILIEALIKNHKELSNKMLTRVGVDASFTASHLMLEEVDREYHEVHTTLGNRNSSVLTDANLVVELARLTDKVVKAEQVSELAYKQASNLFFKYPYMIDVMAAATGQMGQRIIEIIRITGAVITGGLKVSLGTPEQRLQYLNMIDERIQWIFDTMIKIVRHCNMLETMELTKVIKPLDEKIIFQYSLKRIDKMIKSYAE